MRLAYASGALGSDRRAPPSPPPARPKAIAQLNAAHGGENVTTEQG